jgi:hypothetical protein
MRLMVAGGGSPWLFGGYSVAIWWLTVGFGGIISGMFSFVFFDLPDECVGFFHFWRFCLLSGGAHPAVFRRRIQRLGCTQRRERWEDNWFRCGYAGSSSHGMRRYCMIGHHRDLTWRVPPKYRTAQDESRMYLMISRLSLKYFQQNLVPTQTHESACALPGSCAPWCDTDGQYNGAVWRERKLFKRFFLRFRR